MLSSVAFRSHASFFVGNDALLQTIRGLLGNGQLVAITGPGGLGKTVVARAYSARFARQYQHMLWINAATRETLLTSCIALGRELGFPPFQEQELARIVQQVRGWFMEHQDYLLVLDNADDQALVNMLFPEQVTNHILLTALSRIERASCTNITLNGLGQEDGAQLVLHRAGLLLPPGALEQDGGEQRAAAIALAREMGGFPLALDLAGAYIKITGCTLEDYLQEYRSYPTRIAETDQAFDPHAEALEIAIGLSSLWLEQKQSVAVKIVQTCAFLSPDAIPTALFVQGTSELNNVQREIVLNPSLLKTTLETLQALGWITHREDEQAFDIHPLIQQMFRAALSADEQRQYVERALHALYRLLPFEGEPAQRLYAVAHVRQVAALSEPWKLSSREAGTVFDWAASVLWEQQAYPEAEALLRKALAICERALGSLHPAIGRMLHTLGTLNGNLGNYAEAEVLLQRSVLIMAQIRGPERDELVAGLNNLAYLYMRQDKVGEAEACYQRALRLGEQLLGPEHPLIPSMLSDLGMLYLQRENFVQAEFFLRQATNIWEKTQGAEHPVTVEVLWRLAEACIEQEKWAEAEPILQKIVPAYEHLLGADHVNTIKIQQKLAVVSLMQDKADLAEPLLRSVLVACESRLGPEHPDTINVLHNLALVSISQEKWEQAEPLLLRVLPAYMSREGQEHSKTISCLEQLILVYAQQGKKDQAGEIMRQITEIREKQAAEMPAKPEMLEALSALAGQSIAQGNLVEAEARLRLALKKCVSIPETGPLVRAELLGILAMVYAAQGRSELAISFFRQALTTLEQELGPDHPDTQAVRDYLQQLQLSTRA